MNTVDENAKIISDLRALAESGALDLPTARRLLTVAVNEMERHYGESIRLREALGQLIGEVSQVVMSMEKAK